MRVAVHDCFPNHETAEMELVQRFVRAFRNLNWEVVRAVTSDDVTRFEPDCVLATHYTTPKATRYPTIGMMTNPPEYFDLFPNSLENVLTYDAYLPGSTAITQHIRDIHFGTGKAPVIDGAHFYLSCPRTAAPIRPTGPRRLFYVGTRWDQGRHGDLFQQLAATVPLDIYGPESRWRDLKAYHRGRVPFDGVSMIERIREAGIALCIHSPEHLRLGIPTMRIWETIAAGAIVITDTEEFGRAHFGDNLLYIDRRGRSDIVEQITAHVEWVRAHPAEADEMARRAHAIWDERFCLERQFERLPALLARARRASGYVRTPSVSGGAVASTPAVPAVEYIVRAGTRSVRYARRALDSLKAQSHSAIAVSLVWVGGGDELDTLLCEFRDAFVALKVIRVPETGVRSHALWAGLRQIEAPFFGLLDDDDVLHPNHVATVLDRLLGPNAARLARSGGVRVQEEAGHFEDQSHFHGPLGDFVPETRRLMHFGPVEVGRLLDGDKYVLSHSWIASRDLLTADVLDDPALEVLEDLYLHALLAARAPCAFTWRATAEWNWRSESRDNACLSVPRFGPCLERVRLRLMRTPGAAWTPPPPPAPPTHVPVVTPRWLAGTKGLWRVLTQPQKILGRVRRGSIALWTSGPRGLARLFTALGRK